MQIEAQTVTVGKTRIAYYVQGRGFPVLLVMGLGGRAADWGEELPAALAERFQVISVDNRGTGASDKPDEDYQLETMAAEAVAVLDAFGAPRAHVVGISMGGMIAQVVALDHAERVGRLALLSTTPGGGATVPPEPEAMVALMPDRSKPPIEIVRTAMRLIAAPGFADRHPERIEALTQLALARPTPTFVFERQMGAILRSDRSPRLKEIGAPTLVLHGESDPLVPIANGVFLHEHISGSRFVRLPDCGHLPMWEKPNETARALLDFFSEN